MISNKLLYNVMALITVMVWGVTFVSTKVLITDGLDPAQIFIIRFAVAYLCTLLISHDIFLASNIKDEVLMLVTGITGGSLYFISENTALSLTFAANVSLIICCAPILTIILGKILFNDLIKSLAWIGTIIAFTGVGIVVFGSSENYGINPWGDILTFVAALSWAIYCLLLKTLSRRYSNLFITRKVFGYGVITATLYYILTNEIHGFSITGSIIGNLLFLSIGASFVCYLMWNTSVKYLGAEKTSCYIYIVPLVTILASALILGEPVTITTLLGTILIIGGVFMTTT
ncbi:putative amino-acid metabolite efflux pump [Bacteroidaceae bacterium]|uniref:DMT family transporter n=1 Tax=uncultured Phocaeicola sp. TaxID=990718 RepID=UPI001434456B|nr:DMT family transporter [uncultured Phocaeicola sp.]GFH98574.1 putative amino-acid metabolite efflux pump [Bacteroidaceae bacterium]